MAGAALLVVAAGSLWPSASAPAHPYGVSRGRLACDTPVAPGSTASVHGAGFAGGSTVTLELDRRPAQPSSAVADASGHLAVEVAVPAADRRRAHQVVASGTSRRGGALILRCTVRVTKPKT